MDAVCFTSSGMWRQHVCKHYSFSVLSLVFSVKKSIQLRIICISEGTVRRHKALLKNKKIGFYCKNCFKFMSYILNGKPIIFGPFSGISCAWMTLRFANFKMVPEITLFCR